MLEQLSAVAERFEEISAALCSQEVLTDRAKYAALMKEHKRLQPIVETYRALETARQAAEDAKAMLDDGASDKAFRELAAEEFRLQKQEGERLRRELQILLLPPDENDDKNVIVEIRGGAGGEESALFAAVLFRMYGMYAERKGFSLEVLSKNEPELGGFKEISFLISGAGAYSRLKFESGVHRVQRVPETESQGRIHTSTATVAVLPEAEEVDVDVNPADLQIDTFRSSGAGGQHINKTESAIRITHLPSGIVVECQDERSQHKNKDKAMRVLRAKLLEAEREKQAGAIADERKSQVGTGDRSERIRTYNFPQGRVSDHRIGLTLYKLEQFVNGDMDAVIDALIAADTAKKLQGSEITADGSPKKTEKE